MIVWAAMPALLERRLIVVTGKGGVGRTTVARALALVAARRGRHATLVDVDGERRDDALELRPGVSSMSIDPRRALLEWVADQGLGRLPSRVLGSSATFDAFVAAAPGAKELVTMGKVWDLAERHAPPAGLVVLDGPASGHAIGLLQAARTFAGVGRVGPVGRDAARIAAFLRDPARTAYVAVSAPTEMATVETESLRSRLRDVVGGELELLVVNRVLPRRFTVAEVARVESAARGADGVVAAAARAARFAERIGAAQRAQLARVRREEPAAVTLPFLFAERLGPSEIEALSRRLEARM